MKNSLPILASAMALLFASCAPSDPNQGNVNRQRGAVGGAAAGAVLGGIIGHQSGRGLEGAAIGGAVGGVGGATLGAARDEEEARAARSGGYAP